MIYCYYLVAEQKCRTAISNLKKSYDAISRQVEIFKQLEQDNVIHPSCSLFGIEDSLLLLSNSEFVDGVFFCAVLEIKSQENHQLYCRFFENGAFSGYFYNCGLSKLKQNLGVDEIISASCYTTKDVDMEKERRSKLFPAKGDTCNCYH